MARALGRVASWLGLALLGASALLGLALAAFVLFALSPAGGPFVAARVVRLVDEAVEGSLSLEAVRILPRGGVVIEGLVVRDPEGEEVIRVARARVLLDARRLPGRELGFAVELDAPFILLAQDEDGALTIARAFRPSRPSPPEPEGGPFRWTLRLSSLALRGGTLRSSGLGGVPDLDARDLTLDARGRFGPEVALDAEVRLRGRLEAPFEEPISLDGDLSLHGGRLDARTLRLDVGKNGLELVGDVDLGTLAGRVAVLRLGLARSDLAELVPDAKELGGNLAGGLYAESDGRLATVALALVPPEGEDRGGRLAASGALRLPPAAFAAGFTVEADEVDPVRLVGRFPPGAITLRARGALVGTTLETMRAHVDLHVEPSTIGKGTFGPVALVGRVDRGSYEVSELEARVTGLTVKGGGTWRKGGAVAGRFDLDATDLARALSTAAALSGADLPELAGRGRVALRLAGTSARPSLAADVDAARFAVSGVAFEGARLRATSEGPLRDPDVTVSGTVAVFRAGGDVLLRGARLSASLARGVGAVDLTASVPDVATEPFAVKARGALGPRRDRLRFTALELAWPKARYALARPAELRFDGPTVDRLELVSGPRRIVVEGGLGAKGRLAARAELVAVDLAALPPGLVPASLGVAGALTLDATASGTTARPVVDAQLSLDGGAVFGVSGLAASGSARWDGGRRRLGVDLEARRDAGGTVAVKGEVPLPVTRARGREALAATVRADAIAVEEALRLLEIEAPGSGVLTLEATLGGTVGAPRLEATAALSDAAYADLSPLSARLRLDAPGDEARLEMTVEAADAGVVNLSGRVPLELADLLAEPGPTLARLRRAPAEARLAVPGAQLEALAGRVGIPRGIAGTITVEAELAGTADRPRGTVRVGLAEGAWRGYTGVGVTATASLGDDRVAVEALGALGRDALVQLDARLGAPLERLLSAERLRTAPVRIDATVPQIALDRAARTALPLAGTVAARVLVTGSLERPVLELHARGDRVSVNGSPLGAVTARAEYANGKGRAEALVSPAAGGALRATLELTAAVGVGADLGALPRAPARARVVADGVSLAILPALVPGTFRSAEGRLDADLAAEGPLARLLPKGDLRITDGAVAIAEYGDWTGITAQASLGADALVLDRLRAERRGGSLEASAAVRGLRAGRATVEAKARMDKLTVLYEGQDAATVDLEASASGTLVGSALDLKVLLERAMVEIPSRTPRALQSLEDRPDIVVGRPDEEDVPVLASPGTEEPFRARIAVDIPARLQIVCDDPRYDLTLRGNTQFEIGEEGVYAQGSIEVVRGEVEPLGGRLFAIERGRVQFTGGPPRAAVLDAQAAWKHPAAVVTVTVTGPVLEPTVKLSSQPPMDEAQIATLIATGRTNLKPGAASDAGGSLTASEAGQAAANAIASKLIDDVLLKELPLPVDSVALDTGGVRAGTYLNDRVYVGYTRRFDAQPGQNENRDEFRVEYQITSRWTLEGQVGDQRSSGSLIWSRNY